MYLFTHTHIHIPQIHTIAYNIDKQQGPVYSTENYIEYLVITYNGKESGKEYIYMNEYICFQIHVSEALCYIPETNTS